MAIPAYRGHPGPMEDEPIRVTLDQGSGAAPSHRHGFVEVALVGRGSCRHGYRDAVRVLGPGDAFVIVPGETHTYEAVEDVRIHNCAFLPDALGEEWPALVRMGGLFQPLMAEPFFRPRDGAPEVLHLDLERREQATRILGAMAREQEAGLIGGRLLLKAYLVHYLVLLGRAYADQPPPTSHPHLRSQRESALRTALAYVEEHYAEELPVGDLAARVHLSPDHFRRAFRQLTGQSPLDYINRLRMRRAGELLATTALSVTEVAAAVGIGDPSYFTRVFRNHTGTCPSEFRRTSVLSR